MSTLIPYIAERAGGRRPIDTIRIAFENNLFVSIPVFYKRIREYELGLELAEYCMAVLQAHANELPDHKFRSWFQCLLKMKFEMLDMLNDWKGYLDLFNEILVSDDALFVKHYANDWIDRDWEPYIAYTRDGKYYMKCIYGIAWRKKIIQRKWDRFIHGKPVEHIKRHQRDRLTDEEIIRRADEFFQWHNISFKR